MLVQSVYERLLKNYKSLLSLLLLVQCGPGVAVELEFASIVHLTAPEQSSGWLLSCRENKKGKKEFKHDCCKESLYSLGVQTIHTQ